MTSRTTRRKHKKIARLGGANRAPVTTPSNFTGDTKAFPIEDAPAVNGSPPSEYVIEEGGAEINTTCVSLQRCPWFEDLPINELERGQSFTIPLDKFRSDPRISDCRSFNAKIMDRARSNLRMYIELKHRHLTQQIGTRHLKEQRVLKVFRRVDDSPTPTAGIPKSTRYTRGENTLQAAIEAGPATMRPNVSPQNKKRINELLKDYPDLTISGVVNDMIDLWFKDND